MIEITSEPRSTANPGSGPHAQPLPLSDCLQWCMQPDAADGISTLGSQATVVITWPATPTVPANGTTFTIWGYTFTVNNAQAFTSMSFQVTTSGTTTARNMVNMLNANLFFRRAARIIVSGATSREVQITWSDCREQQSFGDDAMNMDALIAAGASKVVTNGVSPEYVAGYRLIFRLLKYSTPAQDFVPVTQFEGIDPNKGCSTIEEACINLMRDAAGMVYTPMPDLVNDGEPDQLTDSILGRFKLEYGWTYRDDNCQPQSGTIKQTDEVMVWNAAFEPKEVYGVRRYWTGADDGFPPGQYVPDFLTTQPKILSVCTDSYSWLWLLNSFTDEYEDIGSVVLRISVYKKGTPGVFDILEFVYPPVLWYQPYIFNVSVGRVLDNVVGVTDETLDRYEVQAVLLDSGDNVLANASEYLTYVVAPSCCEESTDVYFLTPAGGIGTMLVRIDETEAVQEGREILTDVPCNTAGFYQSAKAKYGGRSLSQITAYERVTISATETATDEYIDYFKHFKMSPQRWLRVTSADGSHMAYKFLPEPGGVQIFRAGENVVLRATGRLIDLIVQQPNEVDL